MTTQEVANRLVELCRMGQYETAQQELYADDAVSIDPDSSPVKVVRGLEGIREKGKMFQSMLEEMHGGSVSDPLVAGNHIAITMTIDATMKGQGRMVMEEVCVYQVKDGKIVLEQFFF